MANISVTYSFTNSTTADADEVNQNFTDIINGTSDGTKDMSISALTVAGTATLNGNVNVGNASSDDLTVTASLASTIPIKTTNTYSIGSSTRGLVNVFLAAGATYTVALAAATGGSANWTFTLPNAAGTKGYVLQDQGSGTQAFVPLQTDIKAAGDADYTVLDADGFGVVTCAPAGSTSRTITLPTASDNTDRKICIKRTTANTGKVIIDGEGAETIDGSTTYTLHDIYQSVTLVCDGTGWNVVDSYSKINTYAPTLTGGTNIDSVSASGTFKYKVLNRNYVEVWGLATINPTAGGEADTDFQISLPFASTLGNAYECVGMGARFSGGEALEINADTSNNTAKVSFESESGSSFDGTLRFTYEII